ncbi:hypothetical protein L6R49_26735 [Myxococcota bacterium]|nr:hypothetical protein [Myxococcota bacterium]
MRITLIVHPSWNGNINTVMRQLEIAQRVFGAVGINIVWDIDQQGAPQLISPPGDTWEDPGVFQFHNPSNFLDESDVEVAQRISGPHSVPIVLTGRSTSHYNSTLDLGANAMARHNMVVLTDKAANIFELAHEILHVLLAFREQAGDISHRPSRSDLMFEDPYLLTEEDNPQIMRPEDARHGAMEFQP